MTDMQRNPVDLHRGVPAGLPVGSREPLPVGAEVAGQESAGADSAMIADTDTPAGLPGNGERGWRDRGLDG